MTNGTGRPSFRVENFTCGNGRAGSIVPPPTERVGRSMRSVRPQGDELHEIPRIRPVASDQVDQGPDSVADQCHRSTVDLHRRAVQ